MLFSIHKALQLLEHHIHHATAFIRSKHSLLHSLARGPWMLNTYSDGEQDEVLLKDGSQ